VLCLGSFGFCRFLVLFVVARFVPLPFSGSRCLAFEVGRGPGRLLSFLSCFISTIFRWLRPAIRCPSFVPCFFVPSLNPPSVGEVLPRLTLTSRRAVKLLPPSCSPVSKIVRSRLLTDLGFGFLVRVHTFLVLLVLFLIVLPHL